MTRVEPRRGERIPVAVLGATGAVGQTFVRMLADHPWFVLAEVAASERSAGRTYRDAARWLEGEMPHAVGDMTVAACDPEAVTSPIVFSALDAAPAEAAEAAFAKAGRTVLSNAKSYRMAPDVPLVIPEVNGAHLALLARQRRERGWTGAIVTNANCAATVAAVALAPLHDAFGLERLFITTMQAVSGAGYPGVPSLDILGNVIPYIADEEPKIERELPKLLGRYERDAVTLAPFAVSAQANRVPVEHGHTVCIAASFRDRVTPAAAREALGAWRGYDAALALPGSPERALLLTDDDARPQPRRDVWSGAGMTTVVGRVRADPILDIRLVAMSHNTVRGAAGGSLLNAELLVAAGLVEGA